MKKWLKHLNSTPFGLVPAEAELAATKAESRSPPFLFLPPSGRKKKKRECVALPFRSGKSWPRRHKADGGQEEGPEGGGTSH